MYLSQNVVKLNFFEFVLFWTVMHKNMFLCFVFFFFFLLLRVGNDKEETEISHTELQLYSYTKCVGVWHEIFKSFSHSQDSESLESSVFICSFTAEVFSPFVRFISSDGGLSYCTLSEQIKSSDPRVLFFNLPCIFFYVKKPVETKNSVNIGVTYLVYLDATCLTRYHIQSQS